MLIGTKTRPPGLLSALFIAALAAGSSGCADPVVNGTEITQTASDGKVLRAIYKRQEAAAAVPLMVLIHEPGAGVSVHQWDEVWDTFYTAGYALLGIELRSHGGSDSGGDWQELATDPTGYPVDINAWLGFLQFRVDGGDAIAMDRLGIIGLGTSGSLAAAALGTGRFGCGVAVSPTMEETLAFAEGFDPWDPADAARGPAGDDDDSALGDDDDSAAGDDDDSAAGDDDDGNPGLDALALHTMRWMYATGDEPSATDIQLLFDATTGEADLAAVGGNFHGAQILLADNDEAKDAMIAWCADKL